MLLGRNSPAVVVVVVVAVKAVLRIRFETPIPGDVCSDPVLLGREFFAPRVEFEPLTTFDDF